MKTATQIMYKAELETRNFSFVAYGLTKQDAETALLKGIKVHCDDYKSEMSYFISIWEDVFYNEFQMNKAYRDGEELKRH